MNSGKGEFGSRALFQLEEGRRRREKGGFQESPLHSCREHLHILFTETPRVHAHGISCTDGAFRVEGAQETSHTHCPRREALPCFFLSQGLS